MISRSGFSLVEMLVVIVIIGIMTSIASLSFNEWMIKSNVEAQTKKMVTDISELRILALTTKQRHSITFYPTSYLFKSYSSTEEPLSQGRSITNALGASHDVFYRLLDSTKTPYDGSVQYEIDSRGMLVGAKATVFIEYTKGVPVIDCFSLHTIRVNPGKKNAAGDTCNDK